MLEAAKSCGPVFSSSPSWGNASDINVFWIDDRVFHYFDIKQGEMLANFFLKVLGSSMELRKNVSKSMQLHLFVLKTHAKH